MSEYKESKDNPLHRSFGIWSNTVYIIKKLKAVIEYGNHEELMAKGGEYAKMFEVQAQYYQEKKAVNL